MTQLFDTLLRTKFIDGNGVFTGTEEEIARLLHGMGGAKKSFPIGNDF